jgi:hypothetical protein
MEYDLYQLRKKIENFRVTNRYEYLNILDRLMINVFNRDPNAFSKAKSECIDKKIDPLLIDRIEFLIKEVRKTDKKITKLPDKETLELYTFLKNRYPTVEKEKLYKCVLRYAALGMRGQQWRLDSNMLDKINKLGINIEGFASPFNNYFKKYYSIFKDDRDFGSLGNFLEEKHSADEHLYINPPFTPYVLSCLPERVAKLEKVVIITPTWEDADWYRELEAQDFKKITKSEVKYSLLDKEFVPKFTTTMWVRGIDPDQILG